MDIIPGSSSEEKGRASKKLPSSVHVVVSNDDLLIEILLRLPVVSLLLFKSVSKRWLSLIISPNFSMRKSQIPKLDPPSGFFLQLRRHDCMGFEYDFVSFDIRIPSKRSKVFTLGSEADSESNVKILESCNGLFLCRHIWPDKYYVYNPSINLAKMLPEYHHNLNQPFCFGGMRIAFDPAKSLHYKVVSAVQIFDNQYGYYVRIQIYSSLTCVWSVCGDRFPHKRFKDFHHGIYWNNAIHWLNIWDHKPFYNKLDIVDNPVLTTIQTPRIMCSDDHKLFESRGSLLLLCTEYNGSSELNVYEMRIGYSEWSLKYIVNLDDIKMPIHDTARMLPKLGLYKILSIVLGERDKDSFLFMEFCEKVVQYKIVSETLCTLSEFKPYGPLESFLFVASFVRV